MDYGPLATRQERSSYGFSLKKSVYQNYCIVKIDPFNRFERISAIGTAEGKRFSLDEAIAMIESKEADFHVWEGSKLAQVIVAKRGNTKYLRTESDPDLENNLLKLRQC